MSDLTAERLHEIVEPVWLKHPGTRPGSLRYSRSPMGHSSGSWSLWVGTIPWGSAVLLCEAQMTRWLRQDHPGQDVWGLLLDALRTLRPLVEALASACLAVDKETDA